MKGFYTLVFLLLVIIAKSENLEDDNILPDGILNGSILTICENQSISIMVINSIAHKSLLWEGPNGLIDNHAHQSIRAVNNLQAVDTWNLVCTSADISTSMISFQIVLAALPNFNLNSIAALTRSSFTSCEGAGFGLIASVPMNHSVAWNWPNPQSYLSTNNYSSILNALAEFSNLGECNPKTPSEKHITLSGPQKALVAQIQNLY